MFRSSFFLFLIFIYGKFVIFKEVIMNNDFVFLLLGLFNSGWFFLNSYCKQQLKIIKFEKKEKI